MDFKKILCVMFAFSFLLPLAAESALQCDQTPDSMQASELTAAGAREKALARFIAALLEKDPETKLQMLLKVIEADPENASAPLKAFSAAAFQLPRNKVPMKELNALWGRYPQNFVIARTALMLNIRFNTPYADYRKALEKLLELEPVRVIALPEVAPRSFGTMLKLALNFALRERNFSFIEKHYLRWFGPAENWIPSSAWRDRLAPVFAPVLFNAEFQAEISGDEALCRRMHAARNRTEQQIRESVKRFSVLADYSSAADHEILMRRKTRAMEIARQALKCNEKEALVLYFVTAVMTGSVEDFNKAAVLMQKVNPRFDMADSRFKMFLNAKLFADAEQALKTVPLKQQSEGHIQLLMKSGRWAELKNKVEQQMNSGAATPANALLLLSAAEHLKSVPAYEKAKASLKPMLNDPMIANSVGYVGSVLDRDLEEGAKLLGSALAKEPQNYAYLDSAAWIAYKRKRYDEAEKLIRKALHAASMQEGVSVMLEHAGDIAAAQGKPERRYYELALKYAEFDPEFDAAALKKRMR